MEIQLQDYTNAILVEYINSKLGFSLLYPSLFQEASFTEDATGASATIGGRQRELLWSSAWRTLMARA